MLSEITPDDGGITLVRGLAGSARQLAIAAAAPTGHVHLVVLNSRDEATYCYSDLTTLCSAEQVYFFPSSCKRNIQHAQLDPSNIVQRTAALNAILDNRAPLFIVTCPEAVAEKIATREAVENSAIRLHRGEKISLSFLRDTLLEYGFERTDFVAEPGQFALRGSIVDVFSFSDHRPVRVDFSGDEVESIRLFDVNTQLSESTLDSFEIIANLQEKSKVDLCSNLFDFAGGRLVLWVEDPRFLLDSLKLLKAPEGMAGRLIAPNDALHAMQTHRTVCFAPPPAGLEPHNTITFNTLPQPSFNKNFDLLAADISGHTEQGYTTSILTDNPAQIERLRAIFASTGKDNVRFDFLPSTLHEGFIDHNIRLCCYTDHQLFERYHRVTLQRKVEKSERLTMQELNSLQVGDYVVHIDHGVGMFGGLVKTTVNGHLQEAVKLVYRDNDVLFVNIHGLHRISKYKGKDGEPPRIYKLGTGAWQKLKQTTKSKVKDIAR